ncbi:MAG: hypothetical protein RJB66_320 [Pseudomonadota bacterium]|jgi:lipooligosaccharide transport system permease protein
MEITRALHRNLTTPLPRRLNGVKTVWMRNFLQFRYTFWVTLTWIFFEPFLSLLAIGYGIGNYVSAINGKTYLEFYFPALLTVTSFSVPFFEATYNYYTKLTHQKVYRTILMTPIEPVEILWAELLWAAFKGTISCIAVALVGRFLNIYETWMIIPSIILLFLVSFIGAAFGLFFTTFAKNYDFFNYAVSGFLLPLSFFSDTYFPIIQMPNSIQIAIHYFPLIHGVHAVRYLLGIDTQHSLFISIAALFLFAGVSTRLAYSRFQQLLID